MPPPWLGVQVAPSSSVNAERESAPVNCETKVRPLVESVNRIGSSEVTAFGAETSVQVASAPDPVPSKVTFSVCVSAWNIAVPPVAALVFQSTPIEGSPAESPRPLGAA